MIDIKELKTRYSEIKKNIADRYMNVDLDKIIQDQDRRAELLLEVENLRARRNENASKMKGKMDPETRARLIAEGKALKEELAGKEAEFSAVDALFQAEARTIPNYAHPKAPVGKEDKDSLAVKFHGEIPHFSFKPKDHVQLGESLDVLDFDSGAKVAGQKFYYIKNQLVILQMALERYAMDIVLKHGFTPFITPDIAKEGNSRDHAGRLLPEHYSGQEPASDQDDRPVPLLQKRGRRSRTVLKGSLPRPPVQQAGDVHLLPAGGKRQVP